MVANLVDRSIPRSLERQIAVKSERGVSLNGGSADAEPSYRSGSGVPRDQVGLRAAGGHQAHPAGGRGVRRQGSPGVRRTDGRGGDLESDGLCRDPGIRAAVRCEPAARRRLSRGAHGAAEEGDDRDRAPRPVPVLEPHVDQPGRSVGPRDRGHELPGVQCGQDFAAAEHGRDRLDDRPAGARPHPLVRSAR